MRRYIGERLFDTLARTPQASLVRLLYPSSFGTVLRPCRVPGQGNGLRRFSMKKDMGAE
jgi:hypothetical protein